MIANEEFGHYEVGTPQPASGQPICCSGSAASAVVAARRPYLLLAANVENHLCKSLISMIISDNSAFILMIGRLDAHKPEARKRLFFNVLQWEQPLPRLRKTRLAGRHRRAKKDKLHQIAPNCG
jgi:hypothetical protein